MATIFAPSIDTGNTKSFSSRTIRVSLRDTSNNAANNIFYHYNMNNESTPIANINTDVSFSSQTTPVTNNSITTFGGGISAPGNTRFAVFGSNSSGLYYYKINNNVWSGSYAITPSFNITANGTSYLGCCMTPTGNRLIVAVGTYNTTNNFIYWADASGLMNLSSATTLQFTRINDTVQRRYMSAAVTPDGSRLVVSTNSFRIFFSDWSNASQNYGTLNQTLEPTNRWYIGIYISPDKNKLIYSSGKVVYVSLWNGTNYPTGTALSEISGSDSRGLSVVGYGTSGEVLIVTPAGQPQYAVWNWNTSSYNIWSNIPSTALPTSVDGWGIATDSSNVIYLASYSNSTIYSTAITILPNLVFRNSGVQFTGTAPNNLYAFDISGLTASTPYTINVRAQSASLGNSAIVTASSIPVLGDAPVISSVSSIPDVPGKLNVVFSQSYKGTGNPTYYYSFANNGTGKIGPVTDGSFIADANVPSTVFVYADNSAGSVVSLGVLGTPLIVPCFLEGSKILRLNPETDREEYVPIETLRCGDLIKTSRSGYKAIFYIGRKPLPNPATDIDPRNRLYRFPKSTHKDMIDDLCITGEHCTLHEKVDFELLEKVCEHMGDIYITEYMVRVPACLDNRAVPYVDTDPVTIWHIALENHNIYHNYGIYANGLLVESCSIQYLTELSNMELMSI